MKKTLILSLICGANLFAEGLDYKYDFGVRLEYDVGIFNIDDGYYSESQLRRARLSHKGSFLDKTLFYEVEIDAANYADDGDDTNDYIKYKDNYIGYKNKIKPMGLSYRFKVGNIKVPFSLDSYTNSKYSTFMESPLTDTLTQSRKIGIEGLFSIKSDH